ncbi:sensor histidine kinase [Agromyces sp. NPDC058104]|uniref:sensor histidine kinase n=1 Tax=Agromyces sp. NPDC058104 TaxID=3346342 RepID=UPI0036D96972
MTIDATSTMTTRFQDAVRSLRYLLIGLPSAMATIVLAMLGVVAAVTIAVFGLGLVLLPWAIAGLDHWASWHQAAAARLLGRGVAPIPPASIRVGPHATLALLRAPSTRRLGTWLCSHFAVGTLFGLVAFVCAGLAAMVLLLPFWWLVPGPPLQVAGIQATDWPSAGLLMGMCAAVSLALAVWAVPALARVHARGTLSALAPSRAEELEGRVEALTATRSEVVDAHGAELRRIERDLHDSTQASLVTIAMKLDMAREAGEVDPAVAKLLDEAHAGTEQAMTELRSVIRTIYPPILADRGLAGALDALGGRSGIPVSIDADDLGRVPVAVETAVYHAINEAITNAAKHSGATRIEVRLYREGDRLRVGIVDDGIGGVNEGRGTGVSGIRSRVAALDGEVSITSPAGGPTAIRIDLPCA